MHRRTLLLLAVILGGWSLTACSQPRAERPTAEPTYSVRVAQPSLAAADLWPQQRFVETTTLADADLLSAEANDPALHTTTASLGALDDLLRTE